MAVDKIQKDIPNFRSMPIELLHMIVVDVCNRVLKDLRSSALDYEEYMKWYDYSNAILKFVKQPDL